MKNHTLNGNKYATICKTILFKVVSVFNVIAFWGDKLYNNRSGDNLYQNPYP